MIFSQRFFKSDHLAEDKSHLAFLETFDGYWFYERGSPFGWVRSLYKRLYPASSREILLWCVKVIFKNYHLRVFSLLTTKSKEYSPTSYPISISATKFSCLDKHLSFSVNLQKSQFVGIVESRAGNVLYPIAEDIAETKYVTIYN